MTVYQDWLASLDPDNLMESLAGNSNMNGDPWAEVRRRIQRLWYAEHIDQKNITVHTYSCGCRFYEAYPEDGLRSETHNHPCSNHGGHK